MTNSNISKRSWQDNIRYFFSEYIYIAIFVVILVAYIIINGSSTSWTTLTNIFLHSATLGTISLGMGLIILLGDIDLSVGSSFVFVGGLTILSYNMTGSIFLTILTAIVVGAACGAINGFFVGKLGIPSFITTLATMLIFRSISQYHMNVLGETRYRVDATHGSYDSLFKLGNGNILTIPNIGIIFIIITIMLVFITSNTKFGKQIYATGGNERAARLAGIRTKNLRFLVFVLAGILVGIAAFLKIAKDTSFDPATSGQGFELYAIAACVIGGISMTGGKGSITGIIFGAMSFSMIDKIITALSMNALLNDAVKGAIVLLAVGLQTLQLQRGKDS